MNKSIIQHEFKMITRSKKNILFILALLVLVISYCMFVLPEKQTPDSFNPIQTKQELEELAAVQTAKEARGEAGFSPMSGRFIYAENEYQMKIRSKLLRAFEDENFVRFTHLRMKDFAYNGVSPNDMTIFNSPFPGKDSIHLFNQTILRYQGYLDEGLPITYELLEQKTALQTIQNLLLSSVVLGIFFCAIYFSCDMLTKDRQNRTILQGLPISWYRLINIKSLVAFCYTFVVLAAILVLATIILAIQNGFGSFSIRVPIQIPDQAGVFGQNQYETISLAKFFLMSLGLIPILIYLFIRLNAIWSLLFKNTWLVLMVSTGFLFCERVYFSRSLRDLFGIEISHFPQTFFEVGKVITGEKNYLINSQTITYEKGILVFLITILVIEIILFVVSRMVDRRRFYQGI